MRAALLGFLLAFGAVMAAGIVLRPASTPVATGPEPVLQIPVLRAPRAPDAAPCPTWEPVDNAAIEQAVLLTEQRTRLLEGQLEIEIGTALAQAPADAPEAVRALLNELVPDGATYQLDCTMHPCAAAIRFPLEGGGLLDDLTAHLTGPIQARYPGSTFLSGVLVEGEEASVRVLATIHTRPAETPSQERRLAFRFEAFGR